MPAFLSDWTFWSFFAAGAAIFLSQVPPLRLWFNKAKIDLEIHSFVSLSHKVGASHYQLYVTAINAGGRKVRIREIAIAVARNDGDARTYPMQGYFVDPKDQNPVLFRPTTLMPDDEWSHNANFFIRPSRDEDRAYRQLEANLKTDIGNTADLLRINNQPAPGLIEGDPANVAPLQELFEQNFELLAGEYRMTVTVVGDKATASIDYVFTIFESDEGELRELANDYRYGFGIFTNRTDKQTFIFVPMRVAG